jgi:hypothetical protein
MRPRLTRPTRSPYSAAGDLGPPTLKPEIRYRVEAVAEVVTQDTTGAVNLQSDALLCLRVPGSSKVGIPNPYCTASLQSINSFRHAFELDVPDECPTGELTLELFYTAAGRRANMQRVAALPVRLEGTYWPLDVDLIQRACNIRFDTDRPERSAIVYVENSKDGQIALTGWSCRDRPLRVGPFAVPTIDLDAHLKKNVPVELIRNRVRKFSSQGCPAEFLLWVLKLRRGYRANFSLIVCDHSDAEIPWELVELGDDRYLGALCAVVRWLRVRGYATFYDLKPVDTEYAGTVLSFRDGPEVPDKGDRVALDRLCTDDLGTLSQMTRRLMQPINTVGLVYYYCHGQYLNDDASEFILYPERNPADEFATSLFLSRSRPKGPLPLFFVNACNSARRRYGDRLNELPAVLLERLASGFIGTLGSVDAGCAARFAGELLEAIRGGTAKARPAVALRRLRRKYARRLAAAPTPDNWEMFLIAFLYAYYGNPLARHRLTSAAGGGPP